jgi:hypothetical protein
VRATSRGGHGVHQDGAWGSWCHAAADDDDGTENVQLTLGSVTAQRGTPPCAPRVLKSMGLTDAAATLTNTSPGRLRDVVTAVRVMAPAVVDDHPGFVWCACAC